MRYYLEVGELLRARGLILKSFKSDARKSWEMEVGDEIRIMIGRDAMMEKLQRFLAVYDLVLHERWQEVASVDLRRSEEHTSELQSRGHLVCRLLLEKKKKRRERAAFGRSKETRQKRKKSRRT